MISRRVSTIALAIVVVSAHAGWAQCPFPHPAKAKAFRAAFAQAFVACDQPNGATESNVPSCVPAETFREQGGSQTAAWIWGPKASGTMSFKANGTDIQVSAKLNDVRDGNGPATADGALAFVARVTLYDPMVGSMTAIDLPGLITFPVVAGKGKIKTTLSALAAPFSGVLTGSCTAMELIVPGYVRDPLGNTFATVGFFLP